MNLPLLLIRAAAIRSLALFDPPTRIRDRAAFATPDLATGPSHRNAGRHGRDPRL
jgi:hypothetical protein